MKSHAFTAGEMTAITAMSCMYAYIQLIQLWSEYPKWTPLTIPKPFHKTHVNAEKRIQSTNAFPQLPIPAHWSLGLTSNWQVL